MRPFSIFLLLFVVLRLPGQVRGDFQPWDIRSGAWFNGQVGVGYQFGNHNANFNFFAEADLCATCALHRFAHEPTNLHGQLRRARDRFNFHLRFQTNRDHKMYGTRFKNSAPQIEFRNLQWTYITAVGVSYDRGVYRPGWLVDRETGQLNGLFFRKTQLRLRYDLVSRFHSYYYRKISNTVGYFNFYVRALDDRWGAMLNWGNDVFILPFLRGTLTVHDHGETNSFYGGGYVRPKQLGHRDTRNANVAVRYELGEVQKIQETFNVRMITDRRRLHLQSNNQARFGAYEVVGLERSFHGYWGFRTAIESGLYHGHLLLGADDLIMGRDLQRFAHQGNRHLPKNIVQRLFVPFTPYTKSPLFPWEKEAAFYKKPRFVWELGLGGNYQFQER